MTRKIKDSLAFLGESGREGIEITKMAGKAIVVVGTTGKAGCFNGLFLFKL